MGKLILVRHGHTRLNSSGNDERLRGWLDVPLDDQGMRESLDTAERVAGYAVEVIYSSDLQRARQTAEALRRRTGAPVVATEDLRPWNLGIFAGQKLCEALPFLNLLVQDPDLPTPDGESLRQFYRRYSRCLLQLMKLGEESSRCIVAVTHVRNFLAAQTLIEHGDADRIPVTGGPATGELVILERAGDFWILRDETPQLPVLEVTPFPWNRSNEPAKR